MTATPMVAQILDDSTKQVYGPKTTLVFSERGWMLNELDTARVDTSLYELEKFAFTDKLQLTYQDLGNVGTALQPLFFDAPSVSGLTSGYGVYDPLVPTPEGFQYFDTKSPFIDLNVVLGGQGRAVIDVLYTQNVSPDWNIGLKINRLNIDKQLGATLNEGDRNLESTQINLFSQYSHPEKPYQVLGYFNLFNHKVNEIGGIFFTDSSANAEIFQYRDASILLNDATANEVRRDLHVFQSYGFFKQFQIYHSLDIQSQTFTYKDFSDGSGTVFNTYDDFYPQFLIDPDSTYQSMNFRTIQNEVGLKGTLESIYYQVYLKQRNIKRDWSYLGELPSVNELYIGGLTRFNWRSLFAVEAKGEIMQTGDYLLEGNLESSLINVRYRSQLYQPGNLQNRYFGNHFEWNNDFSSVFLNDLEGNINLDLGRFRLVPEARFTTLNNYVYWDESSQPSQLSDALLVSRFGASVDFDLITHSELVEKFTFENTAYFSEVTGNNSQAFPVPQWWINSRWYWQGMWFRDAIPIQAGFNLHFRSGYNGRAYSPSLQQFHVQNDDFLEGYFTVDPFISMKVNKVFVFFKLTHANMPPEGGYFVTPNYLGQERIIDFGVRWIFFD